MILLNDNLKKKHDLIETIDSLINVVLQLRDYPDETDWDEIDAIVDRSTSESKYAYRDFLIEYADTPKGGE